MDALLLEGVTKHFNGITAVDRLSLRVRQGSVFGLLGPNGAGKTTSLRMIMGILLPDEGSIHVLGNAASQRTQDLTGYLPEERGLYPRMKLREVLVFLASLKGYSEKESMRRVSEWLERFEMDEWGENKIIELSKGMQQKAQFIAAVIHNPPLLVVDEPFSGLDPINAVMIKDVMLELRDQGSTIILSTHRMEQAERMCDAICLIDQGRCVLDGEVRAIKKSYGKNTLHIAFEGDSDFLDLPQLVESVNLFGGEVEVKLRPGADSQEVLKAALERGVRISRFELIEPPLNDIFLDKVSHRHA